MRLSEITPESLAHVKPAQPEAATQDGRLLVELSDGRRGTIEEFELGDAMKDGAKVITQDQLKQEKDFAEAEESPVLAGALATMRGASAGFSDLLAKQTGLITEQKLRNLQEAHPTISAGFEVAGAVAPVLFSGGAGLAGRAAVQRMIAEGMTKEAAELAVSKMGQSVVNKIASAAPSAMIDSIGAIAGAKAAPLVGKALSKTTSNVINKAVTLGIGSSVEGAMFGVGKLISEDQLGNAEFNAENLLATIGESAALGGVLGGATSLASSGISKIYDKTKQFVKSNIGDKVFNTAINQIEGSESFKKELLDKYKAGEHLEDGILALKDPEIQRIKQTYPEAPITKGMESALKPVKNIENYLYDAPTMQGDEIRKAAKDVVDYVGKTVDDIWNGAKSASPQETGELIRQKFFADLNSHWSNGKGFYSDLMNEFGGVPVRDAQRTKLSNLIRNSDAFRIASEGAEVKKVLGIVEDKKLLKAQHAQELQALGLNQRQINQVFKTGVNKSLEKELAEKGISSYKVSNLLKQQSKGIAKKELTLRQVKSLQSDIGAKIKETSGEERRLLREVHTELRTMMDSIIKDSVGSGPASSKVIKGLNEANEEYVRAYAVKDKISELFGIKGSDFDTVLETLEKTSSIDLNNKFLNLKKSDKAFELIKEFPEIGKLVLATKQKELINKHLLQDGEINFSGLKKSLSKMTKEERELFFDGNSQAQQKFMDALTLYEKRPKTLNPSGTDVRRELREMLSPKSIIQNWTLQELYKGNQSALGRSVNEIIPVLGTIEKSSNNGKRKISDAVDEFLKYGKNAGKVTNKAALKAITGMNVTNEKEIEDKVDYYSQDPALIIENFTNNNRQLLDSAPNTAEATQATLIKAVQFLGSKSPKKDVSPFNDSPVSRSDLLKFKNYVEAVENPYSVIENLKHGYFTPESGEAIQTVYPAMYEAIRQEFTGRFDEFKNLSENQKSTISRILQIDTRKAYTPKGFQTLQGVSSQGVQRDLANNQPNRSKVPISAAKNLGQSGRVQSGLDKVLNRS